MIDLRVRLIVRSFLLLSYGTSVLMFPIQNPQKAITSYIFICKNWWLILILRNFAFFYWWREYYHDCKFYLYMCVSKINFNPTIVLCSTSTFAVAILSSLCVEITEPLVHVWRHVRDHAQQVEGEHLVEDDTRPADHLSAIRAGAAAWYVFGELAKGFFLGPSLPLFSWLVRVA